MGHRETTATAPVLDSTGDYAHFSTREGTTRKVPVIEHPEILSVNLFYCLVEEAFASEKITLRLMFL
jgi:hypothetical protein